MSVSNSRLRRFGSLAAGLLLVASVIGAHQLLPDQASALIVEAIRSLHGPGFGLVSILILLFVRNGAQTWTAYLKAAAYASILAGISEAAQIPGPRNAQFADLLIDAIGIVGFLGFAALFDRRLRGEVSGQQRMLLALISVPSLLVTVLPTLLLSFALVHRSQAFPVILDFEQVLEHAYSSGYRDRLERISAPDGWPDDINKIARLRSAGRWGIFFRVYPYPDWRGYSAVSFVAASVGEASRRVAVGIRDIRPGRGTPEVRYFAGFDFSPGPTRYRISLDELSSASDEREFDIGHVSDLVISDSDNEVGVEVLIGDVRLEGGW